MNVRKDYYSIIGITDEEKILPFDDFQKVLKAKYRKSCLMYHPDKLSGKTEEEKKEAEEKFKEITEAYSVLSDENKKNQYDRFGTVGDGMDMSAHMDDMMDEFMKMHGFNMGGRRKQHTKGSDVRVDVRLTVKEMYNGGKKTVRYNRMKPCSECNGKGTKSSGGVEACPYCKGTGRQVKTQFNGYGYNQTITTCPHCGGTGETISNPCHKCGGNGLEAFEDTFTFEIPKGIRNGMYTRAEGYGNYSERGNGVVGDLIIVFFIEGCDEFIYYEETPFDVYVECEIPILDCLTGCEHIVSGLDGKKYSMKIKPNTEHGALLKLAKKGLYDGKYSHGDLKVVVKYKYPEEISKEEMKLIEKLKNSKNFKK